MNIPEEVVRHIHSQALLAAAKRLDEIGDGELDPVLTSNWLRTRAERLESEHGLEHGLHLIRLDETSIEKAAQTGYDFIYGEGSWERFSTGAERKRTIEYARVILTAAVETT
jgi:hypothetical protein